LSLRDLPAVHRLLGDPSIAEYVELLGSAAVKSAVGDALGEARRHAAAGGTIPAFAALVETVRARLAAEEAGGLIEVLNATGILLHTNLGRAPLAAEALAAAAAASAGYANLEYDLEAGARGSRHERVSALLRAATGAQDGLVVNNGAAAVLLILDTFAKGREVVVSRNRLVEIGGGFRLPDVLARSGAQLVEAGTANRVALADFERALTPRTALLLSVHRSNFRMEGFVADVEPAELAALGRRTGVPFAEDLGSGALIDLARYGLPHERTVPEAVADGAQLVAFSGDKLLGGPQAGIVVGSRAAVARLRANPLLRALRVGKATLAALGATLRLYLVPGALERIPLYAMLAQSRGELERRAERIRARLGPLSARARVVATVGFVGGGALPAGSLPSAGLALETGPGGADALAAALRRRRPPLVARVQDGELLLDLRAVPPARDAELAAALAAELGAAR
jgi:L-seryl-tRNA(Ser) seleniumtransferase